MGKLTIVESAAPRSHFVCDHFLADEEVPRFLAEIARHERAFAQGMMFNPTLGQSRDERKRNHVFHFADGPASPGRAPSPLLDVFREHLYAPKFTALVGLLHEPLFQLIPSSVVPDIQVSAYGDGDHYDLHRDTGGNLNLTVLLFLCRTPKAFRGGDLVLLHRGATRRIPFKNNRLVVFPSNTLHRVTKVRAPIDTPFALRRFSLQIWIRMRTDTEARAQRKAATKTPAPYLATLIPLRERDLVTLFEWAPGVAELDERRLTLWGKTFALAKSNLLFLKDLVFRDLPVTSQPVLTVAARDAREEPTKLELAFTLGRGARAERFGYRFVRHGRAVLTKLFLGDRETAVGEAPEIATIRRRVASWR